MIMYIIIGGLVLILLLAWMRPCMFDRVWESTVGLGWVTFSGVIWALIDYFNMDPTWQKLVDPGMVPIFVVSLSVISIVLKTMNRDRL